MLCLWIEHRTFRSSVWRSPNWANKARAGQTKFITHQVGQLTSLSAFRFPLSFPPWHYFFNAARLPILNSKLPTTTKPTNQYTHIHHGIPSRNRRNQHLLPKPHGRIQKNLGHTRQGHIIATTAAKANQPPTWRQLKGIPLMIHEVKHVGNRPFIVGFGLVSLGALWLQTSLTREGYFNFVYNSWRTDQIHHLIILVKASSKHQ